MKFEIIAGLKGNNDNRKTFYYDNESNVISDTTGFIYGNIQSRAVRLMEKNRCRFQKITL